MSYLEISQLKMLEEMVETYYNSGHYQNTILYLEQFFDTPFDFYIELAIYWEKKGYHKISHSRVNIASIIREFGLEINNVNALFLDNVLKLDWCLFEKIKKYPEWIGVTDDYKTEINDFYKDEENISRYLPQLRAYTSKQISRMVHIEAFDYDLTDYLISDGKETDKMTSILLFNYYDRDPMRHFPRVYQLNFN